MTDSRIHQGGEVSGKGLETVLSTLETKMTNSMSVEILDPRSFASVVAEEICASVQEAVEERGECRILLAGGRTPGAVYRRLALPPLVQDMPWESTKLFWGDERWVPVEDVHSNAHMVNETLLQHISLPAENVFMVDTALEDPDASARDYDKRIREEFDLKGEELPSFDVVLLGMGTDGHTASIFPGQDVWNTGKFAVAAMSPDGVPRVSISPEVLEAAHKVFFLVKGEDKVDVVYDALNSDTDEREFPAMIYKKVSEQTTWFIDSAAAKRIERE